MDNNMYMNQQYMNQQNMPMKKEKKDGIAFGVTSFIVGIVSFFLFETVINYLTAILAIVFGIIQMATCKRKALAVTGIITSVFSMILGTVLWIGVFLNV